MKINVGDTKQRKSTVRKNDEGFKKNHYFYIFSFLAATEYTVFFLLHIRSHLCCEI